MTSEPVTSQSDQTLAAVELKPCPFCGASATFYRNEIDFEPVWGAQCADGCCVMDSCCDDKAEAVAAWNRRSLLQQQRGGGEAERDRARLDFLDACNRRLNERYGTNYGWKLILNHNVSRLMLNDHQMSVDLHDSEGGISKLKSCRDAIDERMREFPQPPRLQGEGEKK